MPDTAETPEKLPIFPLATVLFPGAIMPLHIFEDRYKQMMRFATQNGNVFGLSYRKDAEVARETPPEPDSVGCVAKVQAVMPLEEGRMNVVSIGVIRYRIIELTQLTPFVVARIETFSDEIDTDEDPTDLFEGVFEQCREFIESAQALDDSMGDIEDKLPEDPEAFSFIVAAALPIDNDAKQNLLELTTTRSRLKRLSHLVVKAQAEVNRRLEIQRRAKRNGHASPQ